MAKNEAELVKQVCAASLDSMSSSQIMEGHRRSGHAGVPRTSYLVMRVCSFLSKAYGKVDHLGYLLRAQQ